MMHIDELPPKKWQDLQNQTARILSECGMQTSTELTIGLARGTANIDVHAIDPTQSPPPLIICECKHWSTAVSKDIVHGFRTVVTDSGASWGILISSAGFQSGAFDAANFSNVRLMTWDEFEQTWIARWTDSYLRPLLFEARTKLTDYTEPLLGSRLTRLADMLPKEQQTKFIKMRRDRRLAMTAEIALRFGAPWHAMTGTSGITLPMSALRETADYLPSELFTTQSLRRFGEILCQLIADATEEFDQVFRC